MWINKIKKIFIFITIICIAILSGCQKDNKVYFEVAFDSGFGSEIDNVKVEKGLTVIEPAEPALRNHIFGGWFYKGEPFNFNQAIEEDITLTAYWQENHITTPIDNKGDTKLIAHRGLWFEIENTMNAFNLAAHKSYFGIETDVRKSLDGQYILSHDESLQRIYGINMLIPESNYRTIKSATNKSINSYVPTLLEFLELCKKFGKTPIVELKQNFNENEVVEIMDLCKPYNVVFISFFKDHLQYLRNNGFDGTLQYLYSGEITETVINDCIVLNADISSTHTKITVEIVNIFHENNLKVAAWTVDTTFEALLLIELGVDYITTDKLE